MTDTMLLHFEGCFGKTRVLINGNPVGSHAYGYTPFTMDIRKFLKVGDNEIQVIVHTDDDPNGRWMGSLYIPIILQMGMLFARRKLLWSMIWQRQPEMRKDS